MVIFLLLTVFDNQMSLAFKFLESRVHILAIWILNLYVNLRYLANILYNREVAIHVDCSSSKQDSIHNVSRQKVRTASCVILMSPLCPVCPYILNSRQVAIHVDCLSDKQDSIHTVSHQKVGTASCVILMSPLCPLCPH